MLLLLALSRLGLTTADLDEAARAFRSQLWREAAELFPL